MLKRWKIHPGSRYSSEKVQKSNRGDIDWSLAEGLLYHKSWFKSVSNPDPDPNANVPFPKSYSSQKFHEHSSETF